ncbi:MAG: NUDIX hydrolase [Pseudonocardia sp.]|nr:NUDIX hydrolase [Pseudonocardia sp.]
MTTALVVAVIVALGVLVGAVGTLVVGRVRRLHRLHIRTDAARSGLESALARRAAVGARLRKETVRAAAAAALATAGLSAEREVRENTLGRLLAGLDRSALDNRLHAELVDAEQLVVLGRRVHNDAVRDTLDLRSRRLVRLLRLHGTAPLPTYFEIADPEPARGPLTPR